MVGIGSVAQREVEDWTLSRYACYLVIQNADPSKPLVALGQTYFAYDRLGGRPQGPALTQRRHNAEV